MLPLYEPGIEPSHQPSPLKCPFSMCQHESSANLFNFLSHLDQEKARLFQKETKEGREGGREGRNQNHKTFSCIQPHLTISHLLPTWAPPSVFWAETVEASHWWLHLSPQSIGKMLRAPSEGKEGRKYSKRETFPLKPPFTYLFQWNIGKKKKSQRVRRALRLEIQGRMMATWVFNVDSNLSIPRGWCWFVAVICEDVLHYNPVSPLLKMGCKSGWGHWIWLISKTITLLASWVWKWDTIYELVYF